MLWHRPSFALIDEATANVAHEDVEKLFELTKSLGITLITIAHDPEIADYHLGALDIGENGSYQYKLLRKLTD